MIKNIVFDIGNVLAGFVWESFYKGFSFSDEVYQKLVAATIRNRLWYEIDLGIMSTEEIMQGFRDFDPSITAEIDLVFSDIGGMLMKFEYSIPWIQEWKAQGYRIYIISNISEKIVTDGRHALGFLELVDGAFLSYQEKVLKPDAEIYCRFFERYSLKPEECVFIDDQEKNIIAAGEQGMRGILFRSKKQADEELKVLCGNSPSEE